jgi:MoaA/NifB/PqqE/SkfB family radical SAM enzyme
MNKIVKVVPTEQYFSVTWMLGRRCNYDCMYCPANWHDNTTPHRGIVTLKNAWKKVYDETKHKNLKYKIAFTGGEVTANKSFLPFVQWLNLNFPIHSLLITTNGSAGLNHYKKLAKELSSISFSTHTEFIDEQKFFSKAKELNKLMFKTKKSFIVNIMNEYWGHDRIKLYKEFCEKNSIAYTVNEIDYHKKTRDFIKKEGKHNLHERS